MRVDRGALFFDVQLSGYYFKAVAKAAPESKVLGGGA
jgi:hypothetical protein